MAVSIPFTVFVLANRKVNSTILGSTTMRHIVTSQSSGMIASVKYEEEAYSKKIIRLRLKRLAVLTRLVVLARKRLSKDRKSASRNSSRRVCLEQIH